MGNVPITQTLMGNVPLHIHSWALSLITHTHMGNVPLHTHSWAMSPIIHTHGLILWVLWVFSYVHLYLPRSHSYPAKTLHLQSPNSSTLYSYFLVLCPIFSGPREKYKKYNREQVEAALEWMQETGLNVHLAAKLFAVPRSTLQDYLAGKSSFDSRSGPPSYLDAASEIQLSKYVAWMSEHGWGLTIKQVIVNQYKTSAPYYSTKFCLRFYFINHNCCEKVLKYD